ncbi:MAG: lysine--tRNA ligase [Thermoplasmata archaeon]|nr:lysine--tRNA ligase [Thermoplasmata archaeon]
MEPPPDASRLEQDRLDKIAAMRAAHVEPYPWTFAGRTPTVIVRVKAGALNPEETGTEAFRVAGRLTAVRRHGGSAFFDLEDASGPLQLFLRADELGAGGLRTILEWIDGGDIVGATGRSYRTRRGEPSLLVDELQLLAKAIHPPPEKYHGVKDPELRLRQRYVDLLASRESRRMFELRSTVVQGAREFLQGEGFLEVETPTLVQVAGGAAANPFLTHSSYLDQEVQLRVALELPLKRLLVGGMERVFEIGHVFRNEDLDSTHVPEFTMLEAYAAYADYRDMQDWMERLFSQLAQTVARLFPDIPGAVTAPERFLRPFGTVDFVEALEEKSGLSGILDRSLDELKTLARKVGATVPAESPIGTFYDKLFDHYVTPTLIEPTFVLDHPAASTPLAKRHRSKPGRVERFELYIGGVELANAYSELNDPIEQATRFREQLAARGVESYAMDDDFVEALRYGMPPAGGVGFGIDRAVMALSGAASIKDVVLFLPIRRLPGPG